MGDEANAKWHVVRKFINGRWYRYRQKSWCDNGRVRTRSIYLEPADGYVHRRESREVPGSSPSTPTGKRVRLQTRGIAAQNDSLADPSNLTHDEEKTNAKTKQRIQ